MTVDTFFLDNYVVSSLLIIIFLLLKYEFLKIIMLTFIWFFFKPHSVSFLNRRSPIFLFYKSSIFSCTWMKNRKWYGLHDTYVTLRKLCFNSFIWINKYILLCFKKKLLNAVEVQRHKRKSKLKLAAVSVAFPLI